jgi:phosphoenolpyruvate carboxylase
MSDTITNTPTETIEPTTTDNAARVSKLLSQLHKAHEVKDARLGKKIRRQLRKLGYWLSRQLKPEVVTETTTS